MIYENRYSRDDPVGRLQEDLFFTNDLGLLYITRQGAHRCAPTGINKAINYFLEISKLLYQQQKYLMIQS